MEVVLEAGEGREMRYQRAALCQTLLGLCMHKVILLRQEPNESGPVYYLPFAEKEWRHREVK